MLLRLAAEIIALRPLSNTTRGRSTAPVTSAMQNRALAFNAAVNLFVALGMHLLVFEDMTGELRRTNQELATAHEEVQRLAITDALTGCYNQCFFDQIERRELQRHRRYGSPLSVSSLGSVWADKWSPAAVWPQAWAPGMQSSI